MTPEKKFMNENPDLTTEELLRKYGVMRVVEIYDEMCKIDPDSFLLFSNAVRNLRNCKK